MTVCKICQGTKFGRLTHPLKSQSGSTLQHHIEIITSLTSRLTLRRIPNSKIEPRWRYKKFQTLLVWRP